MNKTELVTKASRSLHMMGFKLRKHSPEILVVAGVVGTVVSAVMACKATTKVSAILEDTKEEIDLIHACVEDEETAEKYKAKTGEDYTEETRKNDLKVVYAKTAWKFTKLYAPSVILGTVSIASILTSHRILSKRNVALAAAYATLDKGFKDYRGRVVERFGDIVDKELRYNIKAKEVEETVVDENGEEKTVTKVVNVPDKEPSIHARFFEEYTRDAKGNVVKNIYWDKNNMYNMMFLKRQQQYANDILVAKGYLFLNDVYKMLNLPESKEGQIVGWKYEPENPERNNYVSFGLYDDSMSYSDYIYGNDPAILLDFNVDGNIWSDM